jgi:arsenate reductase
MTSKRPKRVLFLCTGNSARSQMAEALLRHAGGDRFIVVSAGTHPRAQVHPEALHVLQRHKIPAEGLVPKAASKFLHQAFDYVITLCDQAREACPTFDSGEVIHWTFHDPAEVDEPERRRRAFDEVFWGLSRRIQLLIAVDEKG